MRITDAGNVGIGTTAPSYKLAAASSNATRGIIASVREEAASSQTGALLNFFQNTVDNWAIGQPAGTSAFVFYSGRSVTADGTERMRIDSAGNVGIGTSSPAKLLTVSAVNDATIRLNSTDTVVDGTEVIGNLEFFSNDNDGPHISGFIKSINGETFGRRNHLIFGTSITNNADAVEVMRITSAGNVGIGTSSPSGIVHVFGTNAAHGATGIPTEPTLLLQRSTSDAGNYAGLVIQTNATNSNFGLYSNQSGALFYHGGTERMRIDSAGNVLIGKTTATANGGDLQVSSGITFPATQVPKSDANTLDDYEEGTWTPALKFGGASVSLAYSAGYPIGRYTKVGNTVYAYFDIRIGNKGTSTGDMTVEGLPFTTSSSGRQGGSLYRFANSVSGAVWESNQLVFVESSATVIKLGYASGGNTVLHTHADVNNFGIYAGLVVYNV
jgi:hypothetical protein